MEITWPGSYCDVEQTQPHYMLQTGAISEFWICVKCGAIKFLPLVWEQGVTFTSLIKKVGADEAHRRMIMKNAKRLRKYISLARPRLTKKELEYLEKALPYEEFVKIKDICGYDPKAVEQVIRDAEVETTTQQ